MAYELAKAYVQIVPSAQGLGDSIIDEVGAAGDKAGEEGGSRAGGAFGKALGKAGQIAGAAVSAAAAAVGSLAKSAIEGYADTQQLVGGVETLFGAGGLSLEDYAQSVGASVSEVRDEYNDLMSAQGTVLENAKNAYRTAGLSANEYMETATSFAASLVSALGGDTQAAAEMADMAVTDMADNANKMGSDMQSIQNAYQGFAKGNFTMLDNLKLGYGGTQEEARRLIEDAEKLDSSFKAHRNEAGKVALSYDDMVQAIHIVQDNMGIAGTTADEAAGTISGSLGMLSASWQNLVAGIADPGADLGTLIDNLVDSAEIALKNLLPAAEQALSGIGTLVEKLAPIIGEKLPGLVNTVLPSLLSAATSLLDGVVAALPSLLQVLMEQAPVIISKLVDTILENLPMIIETAFEIIAALATGIGENLPTLIPAIIDCILTIIDTLTAPENISQMVDAAVALVDGLVDGLMEGIPHIIDALPEIVANLVVGFIENAPKLLLSGIELMMSLLLGLTTALPDLLSKLPEMVVKIADGLWERASEIVNVGKNFVTGLWNGIKEKWDWLIGRFSSMLQSLISLPKAILGIHSPSTVMAWMGQMMAQGLANGIEDNARLAIGAAQDMADGIAAVNFGVGITCAAEELTAQARSAEAVAHSVTAGAASAEPGGELTRVLTALDRKLDRLAVYIDRNKLVGYLAADMDEALGSRAQMARRGALA